MLFHVDAAAAERNTFGFQAEALLKTRFPAQLDFAAGAEDALPGESDGSTQDADDLASGTGMSGGAGDGAIGRDFAARDQANSGENIGVQGHGGYCSVGGFVRLGTGSLVFPCGNHGLCDGGGFP